MRKKYEGFNFETTMLDNFAIEKAICAHYQLGIACSSDFMELKPNGKNVSIHITGSRGGISCIAYACETNTEGVFMVSVGCCEVVCREYKNKTKNDPKKYR